MRRDLFGAAIAFVLLAAASLGTAGAADLKAPAAPTPWVCPWCGWHVGLNYGYGTTSGGGINNTGTDTGIGGLGSALMSGAVPTDVNPTVNGFVGGGQIGYDWEFIRDWITGIEADFDGMGAKATVTPAPGTIAPAGTAAASPATVAFGRQVNWFGTLRMMEGISVMNNAVFAYGTAGVAVAQMTLSDQFICGGCIPNPLTESGTNTSSKLTRFGGAIGAGLEWMIMPKLSMKAEVLAIQFGNEGNTITYNYPPFTSTLTSQTRGGLAIFRSGLNWYF